MGDKAMVMVVKEVAVGEEYVPLTDQAKLLGFLNEQGQGAFWAKASEEDVVRMLVAPDALDLVALIESTYAFKPADGVDIGTTDLARNILEMFGCGEYRKDGVA